MKDLSSYGIFGDDGSHPVSANPKLGFSTWAGLMSWNNGRAAFMAQPDYGYVFTHTVSQTIDNTHFKMGVAGSYPYVRPFNAQSASAANIPAGATVINVVPDEDGTYIVQISAAATGTVTSIAFQITDPQVAAWETDAFFAQIAAFDAGDPASPNFTKADVTKIPDGGLVFSLTQILALPVKYLPTGSDAYVAALIGAGQLNTRLRVTGDIGARALVRPLTFVQGGEKLLMADFTIQGPTTGGYGVSPMSGDGIVVASGCTLERISVSRFNKAIRVAGSQVNILDCVAQFNYEAVYLGFNGVTPNAGNTTVRRLTGLSFYSVFGCAGNQGYDSSRIEATFIQTPILFSKDLATAGAPATASMLTQSRCDVNCEAMGTALFLDLNAMQAITNGTTYSNGAVAGNTFMEDSGGSTSEGGSTSYSIAGLRPPGLWTCGPVYSNKCEGETNYMLGTSSDGTTSISGTALFQSIVAVPSGSTIYRNDFGSAGGTLAIYSAAALANGTKLFRSGNGTGFGNRGVAENTNLWNDGVNKGIFAGSAASVAPAAGTAVANYDGTGTFDSPGSGKTFAGIAPITPPGAYDVIPIVTAGITTVLKDGSTFAREGAVYTSTSAQGTMTATAGGLEIGYATAGAAGSLTTAQVCLGPAGVL